MEFPTKDIIILLLTVTFAVIGYLLKKVLSNFESKMAESTRAVQENTLAVVKLNTQMEMIFKQLERVYQMEKDLDAVHGKLRTLMSGNGKD